MKVKCRVYTSIGTPNIVIEEEGSLSHLSSFQIPADLCGELAISCLRYAFHNNVMSEEQTEAIIEFGKLLSDIKKEKKAKRPPNPRNLKGS